MRLPHHLRKHPHSGVFYFRQAIPADLRAIYGKAELVQSLRSKDPKTAKGIAYSLSAKFWQEFQQARAGQMPRDDAQKRRDFDDFMAKVNQRHEEDRRKLNELEKFEGKFNPRTGEISVKADPNIPGDVQAAQEWQDKTIATHAGILRPDPAPAVAQQPSVAQSNIVPIKLGEAAGDYLAEQQKHYKHKTFLAKKYPLESFVEWKGADTLLHTIIANDLYRFKNYFGNKQNGDENTKAKKTLNNQFSYLKKFFKDMMVAGHYPKGENPAEGQAPYTGRDKDHDSRKKGFQPFTARQLAIIFKPENLVNLAREKKIDLLPNELFCPFIALYTGTRVNEICQLELDDFKLIGGHHCIHVNDYGDEKSAKTTSSIRLVPLHPKLIELGLMDYVEDMRKAGHTKLFPYLIDTVNSFGDRQTKAFTSYVNRLEIKAPTGKLGMHSFRDTVICAMKEADVDGEDRRQFVGHDRREPYSKDAHDMHYSPDRAIPKLAKKIFPSLKFNVDVQTLKYQAGRFDQVIAEEMKISAAKKMQAKRAEAVTKRDAKKDK